MGARGKEENNGYFVQVDSRYDLNVDIEVNDIISLGILEFM